MPDNKDPSLEERIEHLEQLVEKLQYTIERMQERLTTPGASPAVDGLPVRLRSSKTARVPLPGQLSEPESQASPSMSPKSMRRPHRRPVRRGPCTSSTAKPG